MWVWGVFVDCDVGGCGCDYFCEVGGGGFGVVLMGWEGGKGVWGGGYEGEGFVGEVDISYGFGVMDGGGDEGGC